MKDDSTGAAFSRLPGKTPDPAAWKGAAVLLLVACDSAYVGHAIALARSIDQFSADQHLLIHLVNPTVDDMARIERLAASMRTLRIHVSSEHTRIPADASWPAYYASARFIRMAEVLADPASSVPILALDADALAVAPLTLDFSDKPEAEVCLRRRDLKGEVAEHLRVAAGAVWAKPTPSGIAFMRAVATDLVSAFSRRAEWFVDQLVLGRHVVAGTGGANVRNLKSKFCDWSMRDDAIFWMGKGERKYFDVRYLVARDMFDESEDRRHRARLLLESLRARVPDESMGPTLQRLRVAPYRPLPTTVAIFLPRLDLPWKPTGLRADGSPPPVPPDTVELRSWWRRFAEALADEARRQGVRAVVREIPAWEITPEGVDSEDYDLAFIPHRCRLDFAKARTPHWFYMQEYFRPVFVLDPQGWSAGSSVYPIDPSHLPPAVLGAWDTYRTRFLDGSLASKFGQSPAAPRARLQKEGQLPAGPFVFYPLQVPHDQSIRYFSDVDQDMALEAVARLAHLRGLALVTKEHPANRASARVYRDRLGTGAFFSDAHVHDLIRHAEGVVTINSGVGFEALLAGAPVICLGRAEYDAAAFRATRAELPEVWDSAIREPAGERLRRYARFVDWFLGRHAVDLSRPSAARAVLRKHVARALTVTRERGVVS